MTNVDLKSKSTDLQLYPRIKMQGLQTFCVAPGTTVETIEKTFPKHMLLGPDNKRMNSSKSFILLGETTYELVSETKNCWDKLVWLCCDDD